MGADNYIVVIEIGSSKVTGVIGYNAYDGVHIVAQASEEVNGFISKGVVRNVDDAGKCITNIINILESKMSGDVLVEKAYVAFGGLSLQSRKSTVVKEFAEYTKITDEIIDEVILENDIVFKMPEGYQRVKLLPLECRLNSNDVVSPAGMLTENIECNFQNIIIKEQFLNQLNDSFNMAKITIADSFDGAYIEAQEVLSEEEKRSGAAVVNIGAQTTTVSVFSNNLLRHLVVLPVGGDNITRDIEREGISYSDAEWIKVTRGYASKAQDESLISNKQLNGIVGARMVEILENTKHQIELSGVVVNSIVLTGGGSKLANIEELIKECFANFKVRIDVVPQLPFVNDGNVDEESISYVLYSLIKSGKVNCCLMPQLEPLKPKEDIFTPDENDGDEEEDTPSVRNFWGLFVSSKKEESEADRKNREELERIRQEELKMKQEEQQRIKEQKRIEREKKKQEDEEKKAKDKVTKDAKKEAKKDKFRNIIDDLFTGIGGFVDNVTEDENADDNDDESDDDNK